MRAIHVRAWVEVVGSVMEFISFQSSMKCEKKNFFSRHLAWKAESSLSEDELSCKVLGPAVYTKIYCRVQRNRVLFIPVQWENRVTLTMKRIEAGRQFPMIKQLPWQLAVNRGAVGEFRTSSRRGKTPWGKPVSAINTVRKSQAALRWGPWKFCPSTAYDTLLPHTRVQARVPGQWVGYISWAVSGRHISVGQMSPGRINYLFYYASITNFFLNILISN